MSSYVANNWKELLAYGVPDMSADTFMMILMAPGFSFSRSTHEEYADVSANELPTAYGYTVGGQAMAGVVITNDATLNAAVITWGNVSWVVAGGNLQACGAIIYDSTIVAPDVNPIVGFIDFGGTMTTYNGGTHTVANPTVALT